MSQTKVNHIFTLHEKHHEKFNQECKQNIFNIFYLLTFRTKKIVWRPLVFKPFSTCFPIMNNCGKFKEIS